MKLVQNYWKVMESVGKMIFATSVRFPTPGPFLFQLPDVNVIFVTAKISQQFLKLSQHSTEQHSTTKNSTAQHSMSSTGRHMI